MLVFKNLSMFLTYGICIFWYYQEYTFDEHIYWVCLLFSMLFWDIHSPEYQSHIETFYNAQFTPIKYIINMISHMILVKGDWVSIWAHVCRRIIEIRHCKDISIYRTVLFYTLAQQTAPATGWTSYQNKYLEFVPRASNKPTASGRLRLASGCHRTHPGMISVRQWTTPIDVHWTANALQTQH